jgi:hypothetical protein
MAEKLASGIGGCGHGAIPFSIESSKKEFKRRDTERAEKKMGREKPHL